MKYFITCSSLIVIAFVAACGGSSPSQPDEASSNDTSSVPSTLSPYPACGSIGCPNDKNQTDSATGQCLVDLDYVYNPGTEQCPEGDFPCGETSGIVGRKFYAADFFGTDVGFLGYTSTGIEVSQELGLLAHVDSYQNNNNPIPYPLCTNGSAVHKPIKNNP